MAVGIDLDADLATMTPAAMALPSGTSAMAVAESLSPASLSLIARYHLSALAVLKWG